MDDFIRFFSNLSSSSKDNFKLLVSDISEKGSFSKIKEVDSELKEIKDEIRKDNNRINILKQEYEICDNFLNSIENYLKNNSVSKNLTLLSFRILLTEYKENINNAIIETKPIELLKKKHKIKKYKTNIELLNELISELPSDEIL